MGGRSEAEWICSVQAWHRLKALRMCKEGLHPSTLTFSSVSAGWCTRYMKRHSLAIWQKTKISQHLSKDMDNKVQEKRDKSQERQE